MTHTTIYKTLEANEDEISKAVEIAIIAMEKKGQDPVSQFAGYIVSGDPTYITNTDNARAMFSTIDNLEVARYLMKQFLNSNQHPQE